jgi:hypothetical protein
MLADMGVMLADMGVMLLFFIDANGFNYWY